jgi:protein-L-isoaspartate(D-aspartate) O-methyltransferase
VERCLAMARDRNRMSDEVALALQRRRYADIVMDAAGVRDPRIRDVFATVPREVFLPPPPWTVISRGTVTRTSRIADLYQDVLVALDREQGINNGEPALHAAWLAAVDPRAGETAIHVGAGTGYYTAMLAELVAGGGRVEAYEIHPGLAGDAARNLRPYGNVGVHAQSAFGRPLPASDIIYVNAGPVAPDPEWLRSLRPGGRLIFPWQPTSNWGHTALVTRRPSGLQVRLLMPVGFIPCSGETTSVAVGGAPSEADIAATRSVWLSDERPPDSRATAIYERVWFSSEDVAAGQV